MLDLNSLIIQAQTSLPSEADIRLRLSASPHTQILEEARNDNSNGSDFRSELLQASPFRTSELKLKE